MRKQTAAGTSNLNTNGSKPEYIRRIAKSGLDSIRISLNSAQPEHHLAYYRQKGYALSEVVHSIVLSKEMGV